MQEDKKINKLQKHNSSELQGESKKNNVKKKNKNSSYYYYKNKKRKKNNTPKLDDTLEKNIDNKEAIPVFEKIENDSNLDGVEKQGIIEKEITFEFDNPNELKKKSKIKDLKQAIDIYYYEEELGKFTIEEEKSHLKELPKLNDDEDAIKNKKKEVNQNSKFNKKKEDISEIEPIIEFKSAPLPKKRKSKKNVSKIDNDIFYDEPKKIKSEKKNNVNQEEVKEDLIITREINFDYDAKDLKKKKVLNELKEAIEDFDKMEMLNEIDKSSDVIGISNVNEKIEDEVLDVTMEVNTEPDNEVRNRIIAELEKEIEKDNKEVLESNVEELNKNLSDEDIELPKEKNNKPKEKFRLFKKKQEDKIELPLRKEDTELIHHNILEPVELPRMKGEEVTDKYLDTELQPIVEEDKFTQILNKIDLEEKLKQLAESDESSNYLAENYLSLKNSKNNKIQYAGLDKKNLLWIFGILVLIIIIIIILVSYVQQFSDENFISTSYATPNEISIDKISKNELFEECLNAPYDINNKSDELIDMEHEITEFIENNYAASVIYKDITSSYSFGYNSSDLYYAASTIKILDALYVYTMADVGELDLDTKLVYLDSNVTGSSLELEHHSFGEEFTIRDLVRYAVSVSDNTAHAMLIDYIGRSKIKDFATSLGATNTLDNYDNFGYINGIDAIIYLEALNDLINRSTKYGEEIKEIFINSDDPYLNINESIVSVHKYGSYASNYHQIGIVYDEHPYMVAILTHEGFNDNIEDVIESINKKIYQLHLLYYEKRDTFCYTDIYLD